MKIINRLANSLLEKQMKTGLNVTLQAKDTLERPSFDTETPVQSTQTSDERVYLLSGVLIGITVTYFAMRSLR